MRTLLNLDEQEWTCLMWELEVIKFNRFVDL